ncbi:MAG: RHS repeat domain-containing protein [Mucilaginibacter sp.]
MLLFGERPESEAKRLNWREQHLYGSSRLGMWLPNLKIGTDSSYTLWDTLGHKRYELSNHLGNVMATITDRRLQQPDAPDTSVAYFKPDVANAQEYYAFGSLLPGRTYTANANYRYGFNGKENDNEVKGAGNEQDYGMRIYDPKAGRFLSVDPLSPQYPELTPYQFASNSPIANIDLDGEEAKYFTIEQDEKTGNVSLKLVKQIDTYKDVGGKTSLYPLQYHVSFKGESYTFYNSPAPGGVIPSENSVKNFDIWKGTKIPFEDIFYSDSEAWGKVVDDMSTEWAGGLAMAYSGRGTGSIYEVPGEYTNSGNPYIGRNNTTDPATNRFSNDGRDRTKLKIVGTYDADNIEEGQYQEQKAMDQRGTPKKTLDNKRREGNLKRMKVLEGKYGGGKKVGPVLISNKSSHVLPKSKSQQKKEAEKKREASNLLINHG